MEKIAKRDISTLFFRNQHLLVLTIVILLISGLGAISNLPRLEDPRITTRNATILTFLPGASAARVEALINEKIEDTLEELDEIKKIESTARNGVSSITVELNDDVDRTTNETAFSKIRSRLQDVQNDLPANATIPFLDDNRGVTAYTLIIGVGWHDTSDVPMNLLQRVALDLKDQMLNIPNTELVRIFGGIEEEITVEADEYELAALGLSAGTMASRIAGADSKVSAGQLRTRDQDLRIEVTGALSGAERIARIPLATSDNGSVLTIGDIATVQKSYKNPVDQLAFKQNARMIYVAVRADENVRVDTWTERALEKYHAFQSEYSEFVTFDLLFKQNDYTETRLKDLVLNLVLGALVVIAIVLFTMGWKSALVVGSVLPLATAGSIFSFSFFDQSIHQMSIFGMIIAIGLLIDSAIVMTDEVRKSIHEKGMKRIDALRHSVHHLFVPLLASTLTTILGFMPIFLLPGNAGDFVGPIALSVVLALIFSFFLAMTVIPALAARSASNAANHGQKWYQTGLKKPAVFDDFKQFTYKALTAPKRYLVIATLPCLIGFLLMGTMKVEFFPAADRDMFELQLYLPANTSIAQTTKQVEIADRVIREIDDIKSVHWLIGASTPPVYYNQIPAQDNNSAYAQAVITAVDNQTADRLLGSIQVALNQAIPNTKPVVKKFAQGPPADAPVAFRVLGPDIATLRLLGEKVRHIMHTTSEIVHTRASIEGGQAKLWFDVDETEAELLGLDLVNIANQLQGNLEGITGGTVLEDVENLPVRVRYSDQTRADMARLMTTRITVPGTAETIPANMIGEFVLRPEVPEITRYNGQRVNNIYAYITGDAKPVSVSLEVLEKISTEIDVPAGYSIDVAGESEQQAQAIGGLATFAPVLLTLMVATIILAFRSVALAVIVFIVAILSIGLGMLSLKIAGYSLGFNPLIGSIGLAGVVINDTIVILAAILSNERARLGDAHAILQETYGCGRHVISTTLTTIGGFVPLLLFSGGTFWPPLAVVIAGGIGFGIMLAMFFTPLAYKFYADMFYGQKAKKNMASSISEVQP